MFEKVKDVSPSAREAYAAGVKAVNLARRAQGDIWTEFRIGWLNWGIKEIGSDGIERCIVTGFRRWIYAARMVTELRRIRNAAIWENEELMGDG
jgi:hypothetical protein